MTSLRDMQLLDALARHRHFARAARECGISQPAFSARIRNLELELGVPLVKRGNRFMGFTKEGEIALKWARQLLAGSDGLRQEIEELKGALSGNLVIGVVPTALSYAARIPSHLRGEYPDIKVQIRSMSSANILAGLDDFSLDAGITYLEGNLPSRLTVVPLYEERYVLLAPASLAPFKGDTVTWKEAAALPLCLLSGDMQNRRILDAVFESAGGLPEPVVETNSFGVALAQVGSGAAATIAPEQLADSLNLDDNMVRLSLTDPAVTKSIGLVVADREPVAPVVTALSTVLKAL